MTRLDTLNKNLLEQLGDTIALSRRFDQLTLELGPEQWVDTCKVLRDHADLKFEMCVDLCAVDYSAWGAPTRVAPHPQHPHRFAVVIHLLSIRHNWRLRVRTWLPNDDFPLLDSLIDVYPVVNWYEREAFDLFGVVFEGHPDLRRILTDYGFIGYPFRKDFPLSGHTEMRYDVEQKRVIYQPVTIEPREIVPRIVREDKYGAGR